MKRKVIIRVVLVVFLFVLASARFWVRAISDYQEYCTLVSTTADSIAIKEDISLYVALEQRVGGVLQLDNDIDLRLNQEESRQAYNTLIQIHNPHIISKPKKKDNVEYMRIKGFRRVVLYPDYFSVGKYIYATSDNYAEVYQQLRTYFLTLDPQTHVSGRPI